MSIMNEDIKHRRTIETIGRVTILYNIEAE